MSYLALVSLLLITASGNAGADVIVRAGLSGSGDPSSVQFVQERRKSETITERVKRAWKDLVGYKFDVSCPVLIPLSRTTCTETGKDRRDALSKCISRNPFCYVADASH
jgi:hypothetical protein